MGNNNFSNELQNILNYMTEILSKEFPTNIYGLEYLIVSILDNKKSHANQILDNCLMTKNIEELKKIYIDWLEKNKQTNIIPNKNGVYNFNNELDIILKNSENEKNVMKSQLIGSEHVLLAMLNPINNCEKIQEVFKTIGLDYNFILKKCIESENKNNINNKNKLKLMQKPNIMPLKSDINKKGITTKTEYINQFTISLNKMAENGEIDNLIGRKNEIEKIMKILSRRKKNNVVLVGKGGCGCTQIVYGIADLIYKNEVPDMLKNKEIVMMDVMALVSGTHFRGMFEERVKGLFAELKESKNHILFIDDMQQILRSNSKEKDTDLSSWIGNILAEGEVRVIGTCNFKDYRNSIENNVSISRKLQKIVIEPTSIEETISILNQNKHYYEKFHNVEYSNEVIEKCVMLADRYITDRSLPDSAFDVLDLSGAYTCLINREPQEVLNAKKSLIELDKRRSDFLNKGNFEIVDALNEEENQYKKIISNFEREYEKNTEKYRIKITNDDISLAVSEITAIPVSKLSLNEKEKIANIDNILKERVIGQDDAIDKICRAVKRQRIGLGNKNKPITILALGPSGSGKTLIAKTLAKEIYGSENDLVRIDMSEYSEKSSISKLTGCFTPEMKVLMSDGSYKFIKDVNIGESVITPNGNIKKVLHKFEYEFNGLLDVYRVANCSEKIKCTPNHELLTIKSSFMKNGKFDKRVYRKDNATFIESRNVCIDDVSVYPRYINFGKTEIIYDMFDFVKHLPTYVCDDKYIWSSYNENRKFNRFIKFDESLARLLGYYVSEGGIDKNFKNVKFSFNINEHDYINEVQELIIKIFNHDKFNIRYNHERNSAVVSLSNRAICCFIEKLCGRHCYIKQLPTELFNVSENVQFNFIETAFYGDGNKTIKNSTRYTTVSFKLGEQMTTLLRNLGYNAQIQTRDNVPNMYNTHKLFYVYLSGNDIDKFNKEMPNLRILRENNGAKNIHRNYHIDDVYFYNRIKRKDNEYYQGKVYDLTIEDDSCYIVNTMSVHNSNPGYIGYENGGQLTEAIKHKQYCVLLLDEIEKADKEVYNIFLQLFDEGRLTDNTGQLINFKNVIIIMTSNIGAKEASVFGKGLGFTTDENSNKQSIIEKSLKNKFAPEFINRIDNIIYFNSLSDENLKSIVKLELEKFRERMNELKYDFVYTENVINFIHELCIKDKEYGARPIIRLIQNNIEDKVTDLLLVNEYNENYCFKIDCIDNGITIK